MADMAGDDEEDAVGRLSAFSIMGKLKGMTKVGVPPLRITCRWCVSLNAHRVPVPFFSFPSS